MKVRYRETVKSSQNVANGGDCDPEDQRKSLQVSSEMSSPIRDLVTYGKGPSLIVPSQREPTILGRRSSSESLPRADVSDTKGTDLQSTVAYVNENILGNLPNDLTRLIYLASIRDYNTGTYLHPQLSTLYEVKFADQVLRLCHQEVFSRILATSIRQYVTQVTRYIQFTGAGQREVIATWKSLQAYRATVPMSADKLSVEVFSLNLDTALLVLEEAQKRASSEDSCSTLA